MKHLQTISRTVLLSCCITFGSARPTNIQEQNNGNLRSLLQGAFVGYQTILSLLGYYEDEEVKANIDLKEGEMPNIDPADEIDQTKMQIVGLGLGRTGTTSVAMALEYLGYTVVHDDEQPEITDLYDAEEEETIDLDEFHDILGLRGYNATFKTAGYKWTAKQPEIKAILTIRDNPDKYVDSWLAAAPFMKILESPPYCWMKTVQTLMPSFEAEYKDETTGGKPDDYLDRETLRANYVKYNKKVQKAFPSNRLLTFNVKEGWGPLCNFLGHPIPEGIPFPHVHTRAKLQGEMFVLELITWIWPLAVILPLASFVIIWKRTMSAVPV